MSTIVFFETNFEMIMLKLWVDDYYTSIVFSYCQRLDIYNFSN